MSTMVQPLKTSGPEGTIAAERYEWKEDNMGYEGGTRTWRGSATDGVVQYSLMTNRPTIRGWPVLTIDELAKSDFPYPPESPRKDA